MLSLEYIGNYPSSNDFPQINLFRQTETGQIFVLARELNHVLGQGCNVLQLLPKKQYRENLLDTVLVEKWKFSGVELQSLKELLYQHRIILPPRCNQLVCISEIALSKIWGCTSRENVLRWGIWLWQDTLPKARGYRQVLYYQTISTNIHEKNVSLHIFIYHGRLAILANELYEIFPEHSHLDGFSLSYARYVPEIHFTTWSFSGYEHIRKHVAKLPSLEECDTVCVLYESGIYRYLQQHAYDHRIERVQEVFEKEIWPLFFSMSCFWAEISLGESDASMWVAAEAKLLWHPNTTRIFEDKISEKMLLKIQKDLQDLAQTTSQRLFQHENKMEKILQILTEIPNIFNKNSNMLVEILQRYDRQNTDNLVRIIQEQLGKNTENVNKDGFHLTLQHPPVSGITPAHTINTPKNSETHLNIKTHTVVGTGTASKSTITPHVPDAAKNNVGANSSLDTLPKTSTENITPKRSYVVSLALLKELAGCLGLYYRDAITLHTSFVRNLVDIVCSIDISVLQRYIQQHIPLKAGLNEVKLSDIHYQIWKAPETGWPNMSSNV